MKTNRNLQRIPKLLKKEWNDTVTRSPRLGRFLTTLIRGSKWRKGGQSELEPPQQAWTHLDVSVTAATGNLNSRSLLLALKFHEDILCTVTCASGCTAERQLWRTMSQSDPWEAGRESNKVIGRLMYLPLFWTFRMTTSWFSLSKTKSWWAFPLL